MGSEISQAPGNTSYNFIYMTFPPKCKNYRGRDHCQGPGGWGAWKKGTDCRVKESLRMIGTLCILTVVVVIRHTCVKTHQTVWLKWWILLFVNYTLINLTLKNMQTFKGFQHILPNCPSINLISSSTPIYFTFYKACTLDSLNIIGIIIFGFSNLTRSFKMVLHFFLSASLFFSSDGNFFHPFLTAVFLLCSVCSFLSIITLRKYLVFLFCFVFYWFFWFAIYIPKKLS